MSLFFQNYLKSTTQLDCKIDQYKHIIFIIDNGFIYSVKGNLGSKNSTNGFNITLGEFNKEDIVIDF